MKTGEKNQEFSYHHIPNSQLHSLFRLFLSHFGKVFLTKQRNAVGNHLLTTIRRDSGAEDKNCFPTDLRLLSFYELILSRKGNTHIAFSHNS